MPESFRELRLFVAAYEERSFTAAAARENATQSGVSQHIRKLEDRFGARLFLRGAGAVVPTPAGDDLYRRAVALLRAQEEAARAVRAHAGGLEGEVRVGLMPTMTRCALAPSLARFMERQPNVAVRVVEAYSAVLTPQVRAGELDFAIVPAFGGAPGLRVRPFLSTPEVLVSRLDSGLPHLGGVRLRDLGPLRLVVPGPRNTRRQTIETYLTSNDVPVERLAELDAMLGTLDLVASTGWVTILPGIMMASEAGAPARRQFTVSPLAAPPLALDLVLIEPARRALSAAAAAFLAVLEEETARLNRVWDAVAAPAPAAT
ncbi:LysR family transcriptional regulator [Caldovatus aquaticus]|uniref:LysR family transcriptional regulator n=1 Tax=Caldovatus aquaticus TaxID=2865671 RepID=A0ABS7EX92_9PROT|nr:LysR family transcriptional regulator [Caldovatus aquaticus]